MGKKEEKGIYAIIGLGRFGCALAQDLAENGSEIIVLDSDEEKVRQMREYTENAFVVNSLDKKTMEDTGVQNADVAVVCIGEELATSILTTLNLVSLGIPKVIAKATSPEHGEILEKLGAEVVYPEKDMALRLAARLTTSRVLDVVRLSEKIDISKLNIPDKLVGKTVLEADFRGRFSLNIVAIENGSTVTDSVKPDYAFRQGDILFLAGSSAGLSKVIEWIKS